jgi:hypothetical protein
MKIAIMQPTYLPWIGYFDLIRSVDAFVIYDHVQFEKQMWQQRNRIRNKNGEILLSLSVQHQQGVIKPINEILLDNKAPFLLKHLRSIELAYGRSLNFKEIFPELKEIYSQPYYNLVDVNMAFIKYGMKKLGLTSPIVFSSSLDIQGKKVEALVDVCKKLKADKYLSPARAKVYIDENNIFASSGIELIYQDYEHPVYTQQNFKEFISHLSFIDFLMNSSTRDF